MLLVKIIDINSKLNTRDWFSKNDFFIKIRYNDESRITTTKWNMEKPLWNESFVFTIDNTIKDITLDLYENNKLKSPSLCKSYKSNVNYGDIKPINIGPIRITIGNIFFKLEKNIESLAYDIKNINSLIYDRDSQLVSQAQLLSKRKNKLESIRDILDS